MTHVRNFGKSLLAPIVRWRFSKFAPGTLAAIKEAAEDGTPLFPQTAEEAERV